MTVEHFSTPVRRKIYSSDNLYVGNDTTTGIEQFSTPLRKLSNNSLNERLPHNNRLEVQYHGYNNIQDDIKSHESRISSNESSSGVDPPNNINGSLMPLSDVAFQLYQTKLNIDSQHGHSHHKNTFKQHSYIGSSKAPIYYRPPSSSERTQYGIKSFLPPNFERGGIRDRTTNKVPITINTVPTPQVDQKYFVKDDDNELDESDDMNNPTGDWFNPIVREALKRQPRKEAKIKKIMMNLLYLFSFRLSIAIGNYILALYEYKRMPFQSVGGYYPPVRQDHIEPGTVGFYTILVIRIAYGIFIFNCIISFYKLTKSQDQCLDLPLNNKQRELLGLKIDQPIKDNSNEQEDLENNSADLTIKQRIFQSRHHKDYILPKYNKSNIYSVHQVRSAMKADEKLRDPTDLTLADKIVKNKLIHTAPYKLKPRDNRDLQSNFSRNYNIEFNCSDDEDSFPPSPSIIPVNKSFDMKNYRQNVFRR